MADGSVKMAPQRVDGTQTMTLDSLEPGGAMMATKVEPGHLKMQHLILKPPQLLSTSKLAPGSVKMAPLRAPGRWIRNNMMVPGSSVTEPQDNFILMRASKVADPGGQMFIAKEVLGL